MCVHSNKYLGIKQTNILRTCNKPSSECICCRHGKATKAIEYRECSMTT